ncbi:MAG TPA: glycosyltransferase, partial [Planctomycetota bacterium]|nr:glycosyltransferase [Planctomycetota bacterium]
MTLRVLHAVHNFPPEFRGGTERVAEALAVAQAAAGLDVRVLAGSERTAETARSEAETWRGVPVTRLVRAHGLKDPIDPFRADLVPEIEAALEATRPDVLHVHHWINLGDDLVRRAARRGIPSVVTLHDFYATCALFFRLPDASAPCDATQGAAACGPCLGGRFGVDRGEIEFRVETRRAAFDAELRAAAAATVPSEAHRRALAPHVPAGVALRV